MEKVQGQATGAPVQHLTQSAAEDGENQAASQLASGSSVTPCHVGVCLAEVQAGSAFCQRPRCSLSSQALSACRHAGLAGC